MLLSTSFRQTELSFKVLVIGDASTGKTSFIKRYVHEYFSSAYKATIGLDFALKTIKFDENTIIKLQLWDIAGQERFNSMIRVYYRDALGALIVFDANNPTSFESVERWKNDLDSKVRLSNGNAVPCLLLANKCDLIRRDQNDIDRLERYAAENGFIGCIYTSPRYDINIEEAANLLVREILKCREFISNHHILGYEGSLMAEQLNRASLGKLKHKPSCCIN